MDLRPQAELRTFVVFIEPSASVRVLNAVFPITVVVVVVGFSVTTVQVRCSSIGITPLDINQFPPRGFKLIIAGLKEDE
jgi:hypothetical protein